MNAIAACLGLLGILGSPPPADDIETAEPEAVGLSSEKLEPLDELMNGYVDRGDLAGLVTLVARRGKVVYFEAVGSRDLDAEKPMTLDTIFRLYSMSKPITNVAAMTLVERGDLGLDDPVSKYLPEFEGLKVYVEGAEDASGYAEPKRPMTVRDLMRHTSGLTYGFFGDTPVDKRYREAGILRPDSTLAEMTVALGKLPLRFEPGTRWHYGVSTDVLGRVVEVVSGMPFDQYLQTTIFDPLKMVDTGFSVPESKLDRFASNYGKGQDGKLQTTDSPSESRFARPATLFSGGGGLVGTTMDYLRFLEMLRRGGELDGARILDAESVRQMTSDQLSTDPTPIPVEGPYAHGLGFGVLVDNSKEGGSLGEYQWGGAASTIFWVDPKEDLVVIMMTQFMPSGAYPIRSELKKIIYDAMTDRKGEGDDLAPAGSPAAAQVEAGEDASSDRPT